MLRKCASIDEYLDNEWSINLLGWINIANSSNSGIPKNTTLASITLNDSIFNYRKLMLVSSDEAIVDNRINPLVSNNQIFEGVNSWIIPVPKNQPHETFQFTLLSTDYNSYLRECVIQVVISNNKRVVLIAGRDINPDATVGGEINSVEIYGLGKRNFVKEKKLKVFYSKFHKNNTSFYYKHL